MYGSKKTLLPGILLLTALALLSAGCGSAGSNSSPGTSSASATATCAPNRFKTTVGAVQSTSSSSLQLKDAQDKNIQISYNDKTRFQRETSTTPSALKDGTLITVVVNQNSNNTYTASLITLLGNRGNGAGNGFGNGNGGNARNGQNRNSNCFRARQGGNNRGNGNNSGSTRGITGTVGQLSNNTLTVTDAQGSDYTIALDNSTKIIQFESATASSLKTGDTLSATGQDDGKGGIVAQNVTVLLPGTTLRPRG